MKKLLFLMCLALVACDRKEDRPADFVPHIAGAWAGTGTDDSIGFYNWSINITQSNDTAAGSFDTSGGYGTTTGSIYLRFGPVGGNNLTVLTMDRTGGSVCPGTITMNGATSLSSTSLSFRYTVVDCRGTNYGGANLHKVAGTN